MPNTIKVKRGKSAALNTSTEKLQAGEILYNLDKNYLTVGAEDNDALTKKPVAAREIVGYTGDTDSKIGTSTTEAYSIKYDTQLKIKDGDNTLLVPKKNGTLATTEDITAELGNYYTKTESDGRYSQATNLENGTGTSSIQQKQDSGYTGIAIKTKNPNAYALDNTLTDNEPIGGIGDFASSFGGVSSAQGKRSHAEGINTVAIGKYSHVEGDNSVALGNDSHAEGNTTVSKGQASHAEGGSTKAIGDHSHSEGSFTESSGESSHAEGYKTTAGSDFSHAEGYQTITNNGCSHTEGYYTKSSREAQHVEGRFNADNPKALHIVGNGSSDTDRKNAFVVLEDGRAKVQSAPTEDDDVVRKLELDGVTVNVLTQSQVDSLF